MKKSKVSLMVIAAVAAITSAFATRPDCLQCEDAQQYLKSGSGYQALGDFGIDYDCDYDPLVTCTYYRSNGGAQPAVYVPCRFGKFVDLTTRTHK